MAKTDERDVEKYLVERMKSIGLECDKFDPTHRPGMPDRIVLLPARRVLWVETKTIGGELSELQKYQHKRLKAAGHDVRVIWTKEQVDALIPEIEKWKSEE